MSKELLVDQFVAITGADPDAASHFLESCGGDVQRAVDLFFHHGNNEVDKSSEPGPSSVSNGNAYKNDEEDGIRSPIPQKNDILVEESFDRTYASVRGRRPATNSVFDKFRSFQRRGAGPGSSGSGSARPGSSGSGSARPGSSAFSAEPAQVAEKLKSLEILFRPPLDITHKGSFESAKLEGMDQKKWILVNIQRQTEFACQTLNRDVWSTAAVKEIVKSNFVFWQVYDDSAEGKRFCTYYRTEKFPFVCVIDPRTGELLTMINSKEQVAFCEAITSFLDQHPTFQQLDVFKSSDSKNGHGFRNGFTARPSQQPGPSSSSSSSSGGPGSGPGPSLTSSSSSSSIPKSSSSRKRHPIDFSTSSNSQISSADGFGHPPEAKIMRQDSFEMDTGNGIGSGMPTMEELFNVGKSSKLEDWKDFTSDHGYEIKILLRLPNGSREQLNIASKSRLKAVLLFVANLGFPQSEFELVLNFPSRTLDESNRDRSLEDLGLNRQETIFVQKRDE